LNYKKSCKRISYYTIPEVPFATAKDFLECIQGLIHLHTDTINIWYDKSIDRVKANIYQHTSLQFSFKLQGILRLTKRVGNGLFVGSVSPSIKKGYFMYIYSDIVKDQVVGDTMAPLLRVVDNMQEVREFRTVSFRPYYKYVCKTDFDEVDIPICNEIGEELKFYEGPLSLTLHFRPRDN